MKSTRWMRNAVCIAMLIGLAGPVPADAASCTDLATRRTDQFRHAATSGATRCLKRSIRTGVVCPDAKLTAPLAKKRARSAAAHERRCPGGGLDEALRAVQNDVFCDVLAACPSLPIGALTQRIVAGESGARSQPRELTIDIGWQGLNHASRLFEGTQFTTTLANCDGVTDTLCDLTGATTGMPFGPPSPLAAAGLGTCMVFDFASDIAGTIDVATGDLTEQAMLHGAFYAGGDGEQPCPVCATADGDPQVGESGLCSAGDSAGQPCTVEGVTAPVVAGVSRDCLPFAGALVREFTIDVTATTGTVSFGTTVDSPRCTGTGWNLEQCVCAACNDVAATPCTSNADCPLAGGAPGICGGRRCFGGTNDGAPCSATSECPGSQAICARAGQPTQKNSCYDNVCTPTAEGGVCADGPTDTVCELEPFRSCVTDDECPRPDDHCVSRPRSCFADPITATGSPDVPADDAANPTLVGAFCLGPTYSPAMNYAAGLPGPVRFRWPAELTFAE